MMRARNTKREWGWIARLLHWTMALLVLLQLGLAAYILSVDDLVRRFEATQWHKSWGTVIFTMAVLRLIWRLANSETPEMPQSTAFWQVRAARASHVMLYLLLLLLPVTGWVYASASPMQTLMEIENRVFDAFALPDPWSVGDERVAAIAYLVHGTAALVLVFLVTLHAAAALRHHFIDRDHVLARMTWMR